MCGIAGVVETARDASRWLAAMERSLVHRGPDQAGYLTWDGASAPEVARTPPNGAALVGLVFRRLAILDLSDAASQPMSTADGRFHLVFNGEIYNYVELRAQLEAEGATFTSSGDTEVLLAGYRRWGNGVLARLVGMFAFAVLDTVDRSLFLARDFFGIKPLYYATWPGGIAFASEIRALLEIPTIPRTVNPTSLHRYLRTGLADHESESFFAHVHQLPPASTIRISLDDAMPSTPHRYWSLPEAGRHDISFDEAVREMRRLFLESVQLHLRSDVPVGTALSGGIDSSSIVASMRHLRGHDVDLNTFSYIAGKSAFDEEHWVDVAVEAAKTSAHKVSPTAPELVRDLDQLIAVQGEPFASTSVYAQYRVFQLAHGTVKVMLDGQGADELLAGYRGYAFGQLAALVRHARLIAAGRLLAGLATLPDFRTHLRPAARAAIASVLPSAAVSRARRRRAAPSGLDEGWFVDRVPAGDGSSKARGIEGMLREAFTRTSLPALLRYEDRNSMAFSIESRVPFLTPELATFAFSLPSEYLVGPTATSKYVFREAMKGVVPAAILERRDKIGFATPEQSWLNELRVWVDNVVQSDAAMAIPALDGLALRAEWTSMSEGARPFNDRMWRWLNLVRWSDQFSVAYV